MSFNLTLEYGGFIDLVLQSIEEFDKLEHFGVKGMKWGIRRSDPTAVDRMVGLGPDKITRKTASGVEVTLTKEPPVAFQKFLARHNERFVDSYNSKAYLTITDKDGKKIGDASVQKKSADELNLVWLGINKNERGKGYASAIMPAAAEFGRREGFKRLTLEVPGNAPDARHIYTKLGFKEGKYLGNDPVWGGLTEMTYDIGQAKHAFNVDEFLEHYGVKGMKWGQRKNRGSSNSGTSTSSVKNMSDADLRAAISRIQMEKQYRDLTHVKTPGEVVGDVLMTVGGTAVKSAATAFVAQQVGSALKSAVNK